MTAQYPDWQDMGRPERIRHLAHDHGFGDYAARGWWRPLDSWSDEALASLHHDDDGEQVLVTLKHLAHHPLPWRRSWMPPQGPGVDQGATNSPAPVSDYPQDS